MRSLVLAAAVVALAFGSPAAAQDKAEAVLKEMRQALGGDRLAAAKGATLEGTFAREMGQSRRVGGTVVLSIALPDKMHRAEIMTLQGNNMFERITATNGTVAWEEIKQRGSGVGMGGKPDAGESPEAIEQARLRRTRTELARYAAVFFGAANLPAKWLSVAQSGANKADVIELQAGEEGPTKLFVDQANHMPMMIQYLDSRPAPIQVTLLLADFKEVEGVKLPHRVVQVVDGKPFEEWTLKKAKFNPQLRADWFDKK